MPTPDEAMPSRIPRRAQKVEEISRAADRLRGQVVHTPLIGDVRLRLGRVVPGPRIKAECLQTGGSVEYRGALHYLLRGMGGWKGLVLRGSPRRLLACARAGVSQRLPMVALPAAPLPAHYRELITACGCSVADTAAPTGYHVMPGIEAEDFALGVATLGLELGNELPADLARVYVSPAAIAPAVAGGLLAAGHGAQVVAVDKSTGAFSATELAAALLEGLHLGSDGLGMAALGQALADGDVDRCCAVLSC